MQDQYIIKILMACTILLVVFGLFLVLFIMYMRNKKNAFFSEKQHMQFEYQNGRIEEAERIQNEVAREVHDNILQMSCLLKMSLCTLRDMSYDSKQLETIKYVSDITEQMVEDAKKICFSLNSDYIKSNGLKTILEDELIRTMKTKNIDYKLNVKGAARTLNVDLKMMIFRIAKEAIQNVVKHAGATTIELILDFQEHCFLLNITDDGLGFAREKLHAMESKGIAFMYQRAKLLDAELHIDSKPGAGCTVSLCCKG